MKPTEKEARRRAARLAVNRRVTASLTLLAPAVQSERKELLRMVRGAIAAIQEARRDMTYDLSHADKLNLLRYRAALAKAAEIFPKLHRVAKVLASASAHGKFSKSLVNHEKPLAQIDALLKSYAPRNKHRNEEDKRVAKAQARLILSRVGRRCSVDDLAAALHGTAGTFRNIK